MSDVLRTDEWQRANHDYLTAAVAWLRLRLKRLAQQYPARERGRERRGLWARLFGGKAASRRKRVTDADVARAAAAMEAAAQIDPPPALLILGRRLGLSSFEQNTLLLCAAIEIDTAIAGLCARAQDNATRPYPTFALALALFDEPEWAALAPESSLRYWQLIEVNQPGATPLTASPLRADERIVSYLKGHNFLDSRLSPVLSTFDVNAVTFDDLPPSQRAVAQAIARRLSQGMDDGSAPLLQLVGPDSPSKQLVARAAAGLLGLQLVRLPVELLPRQPAELGVIARLWHRETRLIKVALYLDVHEELEISAAVEGPGATLHRLLARDLGLVLLDTREVRPGLGPHSLPIDVYKPAPAEQQHAWRALLGPDAGDTPAQLAGQFDLNLMAIHQVALSLAAELPEGATPSRDQVWEACLLRTRPRLDKLAQWLEPKVGWDDLVLPEEQMALLRQIAAQVDQRSQVYDGWGWRARMNRGLGITALFAGESGTGKTMAAEVIARHLRLNLYRIDLSAVVSKYIGETEKNLRRVFDAAEDGGAILFFDEADALFGKRSEVKDSHDRYANIEINYLLQRMEAYRGLAILATNMKSALDHAFLRRLRFIARFPFPDLSMRREIWQKVFPPETRTEALDYDVLGGLSLTGGSIHNSALNAAFLAAQAGSPVTMPLLLAAARSELRKLERPVSEADFRPPAPVRARGEAWRRLVADKAAAGGIAVDVIDYERLAWIARSDEQIAAVIDGAIDVAAREGEALTTARLLDALAGWDTSLSSALPGIDVLYGIL